MTQRKACICSPAKTGLNNVYIWLNQRVNKDDDVIVLDLDVEDEFSDRLAHSQIMIDNIVLPLHEGLPHATFMMVEKWIERNMDLIEGYWNGSVHGADAVVQLHRPIKWGVRADY